MEMASPGNRHCANCIGTLSFPICTRVGVNVSMTVQKCRCWKLVRFLHRAKLNTTPSHASLHARNAVGF